MFPVLLYEQSMAIGEQLALREFASKDWSFRKVAAALRRQR